MNSLGDLTLFRIRKRFRHDSAFQTGVNTRTDRDESEKRYPRCLQSSKPGQESLLAWSPQDREANQNEQLCGSDDVGFAAQSVVRHLSKGRKADTAA